MSQAGFITNYSPPTTPSSAFHAYPSSTITGVTGDNTTYTIIFNTTQFDNNGDFNTSTGTFTAPTTGLYQFNAGIGASGIIGSNTYFIGKISVSSGVNIAFPILGSNAYSSTLGDLAIPCSCLLKLTAAQTVTVSLQVAGNASKNVNIIGGIGNSYFSGFLVT